MKYKMICLLGLVLAETFFSSCATKGILFQAVQPIPPDKGVLYVYNIPPKGGYSEVIINDTAVGILNKQNYLAFLCDPGPLTVSTGWETDLNNVDLNIQPGSRNYVRVVFHYNFAQKFFSFGLVQKYGIEPKIMPEQEGAAQIKKCRLSESSHGLAKVKGGAPPGTDLVQLNNLRKFYVYVGEESRKTSPFIVSGLTALGYTVQSGAVEDMPSDTDCLVKPAEKWFWDLGNYLLALNVAFLNPQTRDVYALVTVERAKVQGRRGPKIMATEALNTIFNNGMPQGVVPFTN